MASSTMRQRRFRARSLSKPVFALALGASLISPGALAQALDAAPIADAADGERLKETFADAVKRFKDQRHAEALSLFLEIADATDSPNAHLYVGHCLVALGRQIEAHAAFSRVLKVIARDEHGKYGPTREAAVLQLAELDSQLAKLVVSLTETPPGLVVQVDGARVDPSALGGPLIVEPGLHRIEAAAPGRIAVARELQVERGEMKTLALSLDVPAPLAPAPAPVVQRDASVELPPVASRAPLRVAGFVASGVGAIGLGVFAIAGLSAKAKHDELATDCARGCSDASHRRRIDEGKRLQMVANVGLVAGLAGAVAGGTLLYFGYAGSPNAPESARETGSVVLVANGAVLAYRSAF